MNKLLILSIWGLMLFAAAEGKGGEIRSLPHNPEKQIYSFTVYFNGEKLKGEVLFLDARTSPEKEKDIERGRLTGEAILFAGGHGATAVSLYAVAAEFALMSKSGIVIAPVTDTPNGKSPKLRGDGGKELIFMEVAKACLAAVSTAPQEQISDIRLNMEVDFKDKSLAPQKALCTCTLGVIGWSHGALLARRFASAWPDTVTSLAQLAPAGYNDWGGRACRGPCCISISFVNEALCSASCLTSADRSTGCTVISGMTKGLGRDIFRSCRPWRAYRDLQDCTLTATDEAFPVTGLKSVAVIFGKDDSLFSYKDFTDVKEPDSVSLEETEAFFTKHYPSAAATGAKFTLKVLPGHHSGPLRYKELWARETLAAIEQLQ